MQLQANVDFAEAINSNFEQLGRMIDTVILPRFDSSWEQCAHSSPCISALKEHSAAHATHPDAVDN